MTPATSLPIDAVLPELFAGLRHSNCAVLQAPTGAGKTTRVPTGLLDSGLIPSTGQILVLEPRRLAARAAARRMSAERGTALGSEIGYQVRFDQRCDASTRILVVTEGILIRRLQDDPFLESIAAILFDEFHERSVTVDLALAMARRVQQTVRPDLKLVVMSATLAAEPVARFLGRCPVVTSEGRLHPVNVEYLPQPSIQSTVDGVAHAVLNVLPHSTGDILVFLPGSREIHDVSRLLAPSADRENLSVMQLYGDLTPEQQDQVLVPLMNGRRKVVLATNVAETSVTIEGIRCVVDSGLARQLQFDPQLGLDRLVLTKISKASADQRAGRAGRTQPGVCVRLWTEREHRGLSDQTEPEIRRVDVAGPVLELLCWGESDISAFPWFEPPRPEAVSQAMILLERLGAIQDGQPTTLGRQMVRLPVHPRLSRMLLEGLQRKVEHRIAWIAALLTERDPFERKSGLGASRGPMHHSDSELLDRLQLLEQFEQNESSESVQGRLHRGAASFLVQARRQLLRQLNEIDRGSFVVDAASHKKERCDPDEAVLRCVLAAFPDRVARRREPLSRKGIMVGGRGVRLHDLSPVLDPELFVCVETDAGQSETLVRLASGIEASWLAKEHLENRVDVSFDVVAEKVTAVRRTRYLDLVLAESAVALPSSIEVAAVLADAARSQIDRVIPADSVDFMTFLSRVQCLKQWSPNSDLPDLGTAALQEILPELCNNCRSFAELRQAPWLNTLMSRLSYSQLQFLNQEAPEKIRVPSGSQIPLTYELGRAPILAVRIQELFGLAETPRIAGGKVPVVLHLLGPNYRPQQITDDLKSFWNNTYPEVRKELRRRYPKHAWPEDPWTAKAERKPGKKTP